MARPIDYVLLRRVEALAYQKSYPAFCPFVESVKKRSVCTGTYADFIAPARVLLVEVFDLEFAEGDPIRGSAYTSAGGARGNELSGEFDAR